MAIMKGAEPFLFPGGEHGVLLVHGFTGSPSEMRLLGEFLSTQGYTVLAPRLCGHGSRPEEMAVTGWPQWYADVEDGYHMLAGYCHDVAVVGLSMGGLLSLKLAAEYPVSKVAALSAPIYIAEKRLPWLPVYRLFRKYVVKQRRKIMGVDPVYSVCYDRTPLSSLGSLLKLIKHVDGKLPSIDTPALIIQSCNDRTVRPQSARHIYERLSSAEKQLVWLERSGHIVTLDIEHGQVFSLLADFLKQ